MSVKKSARELGLSFLGTPGLLNAMTDVPGVQIGKDPMRTGVTVILPKRCVRFGLAKTV